MVTQNQQYGRKLALCILNCILLTSIISNNNLFVKSNQLNERIAPPSPKFTPQSAVDHPPISIDGDAALDAFCAGNSTDGLSWATAHRIANYSIDCALSGSGILIQSTSRYLYLENVTVINAPSTDEHAGINLVNCTNILVQASNLSNNNIGLKMTNCSMCRINSTLLQSNGKHGTLLSNCNQITIENNVASSNTDQGIYLFRSRDNILDNNSVEYNGNNGFCFDQSKNNTLLNNHALNQTQAGYLIGTNSSDNVFINNSADRDMVYGFIFISYSQNNQIFNNTATNTKYGIALMCENNNVTENTIQFVSAAGIKVTSTIYPAFSNLIYNNSISNGTADGIFIIDPISYNTSIQKNRIYNVSANGIRLYGVTNTTIVGNLVTDCSTGIAVQNANGSVIKNNTVNQNALGIGLTSNAFNNLIYRNQIVDNTLPQASDNGTNTLWDNGSAGNLWSDYSGTDPDDDFGGEVPYTISGSAGAQDHYPFVDDGDDIAPAIISSGLPSACGIAKPSFTVDIVEGYILDEIWFSYNGGLTNYSCTQTGLISDWASIGDGPVLITFWANDSVGHLGKLDVIVQKDVIPPTITIRNPKNDVVYDAAPNFAVDVIDSNLDQIWYRIGGNPTQYFCTGSTGSIDPQIWASLPAGKVSITFYANDTAGNEVLITLTVVKGKGSADLGWVWPSSLIAVIAIAVMIGYYVIKNRKKRESTPEESEEEFSWD